MSHLEGLKYKTLRLVPESDKKLAKVVESTFAKVAIAAQDNTEAIIDSRDIDMHALHIDLSELRWTDDYELSETYRVEFPLKDGEEFPVEEECSREYVENKIEALEEELDALEGEAILTIEEGKRKARVEIELDAYKGSLDEGGTPDEPYWNTVWRPYGDEPDADIVARCGLGTVKFLTGPQADETYITLLGCGMDLTAKLIAYVALAHEAVDHKHVSYFVKDIENTVSVMGESIFKEVCEKLKITKSVNKARKAQKLANEKWQRADARRRAKTEKAANKPASPKLRKLLEAEIAKYVAEAAPGVDTSWLELDQVMDKLLVRDELPSKKLCEEIYAYRKAISWHVSAQQILAIGQPVVAKP